MKKRIVLSSGLWLLTFITVACTARNVVVKVTDKEPNLKKDGVFYALPRDETSVEIPVVKSVKDGGKYRGFTRCFFFGEKLDYQSLKIAGDS